MSGPTFEDIVNLSHELQMDLRAANGKLTTIRSWLAAQPQPLRFDDPTHLELVCPRCGIAKDSERALAFHIANVHDGPPVPLTPEEANA